MNGDVTKKKIRLDSTASRADNPLDEPHKKLLYAIIECAVDDLKKQPPGTAHYTSAEAFFRSKEYKYIADVLEISIGGDAIIKAIEERRNAQ